MLKILNKIHQDHEKVSGLFEKIQQTTDGAEKTRSDMCEKLVQEIAAHAQFEEEVFYPFLRDNKSDSDKMIDHALEEHAEVKDMLHRLQGIDVTSEEFMELIEELKSSIEEHVAEEEDEIFEIARQCIGEDDSQEMARNHDRMMQEQRSSAAE